MKITYSDLCKCDHISGVHKIGVWSEKLNKYVSQRGCDFQIETSITSACPCVHFNMDNLRMLEKLDAKRIPVRVRTRV